MSTTNVQVFSEQFSFTLVMQVLNSSRNSQTNRCRGCLERFLAFIWVFHFRTVTLTLDPALQL